MTIPTLSLLAQAGCNPGQGNLDLGECFTLGVGSSQTVGEVYDSPATLVNLIISNLFILAGLIAFVAILYAGFLFIYDSSKAKGDSKKIFETAIVGFGFMFAAYWLVRIAEVITGIDNLIF